LFPVSERTGRFFRYLGNDGKPTKRAIGKNILSKYPSEVAAFLNLSDPGSYTGHCLRRTGATWLAESGVSTITLKQAGRWKSDTVCHGYVDESNNTKIMIANAMAGKATSDCSPILREQPPTKSVTVSNNTHCSFILHI
jgi:integrase